VSTGEDFQVLLRNTAYRSDECLAVQPLGGAVAGMYQRAKNPFNARSFVSSYFF
jgi:hypothetical protein